MAGPNLTTHTPINFAQSLSQKGPFSQAIPERAGQTFKGGTPVQPYTTGLNTFTQAWDGTTVAAGIWGIAYAFGQNLATNGAGAPTQFNPVGPPRATQTFGSVPNQPSAVNIAIGAPASDGRTYFMLADGDNIFEATYDNSNGTTSADYTPTSSQIGTAYGLTVDANGYWYVDGHVTGSNAVAEIVGANPDYGFGEVNGIVRFIIIPSARFIGAAI
ncbi:MAG TPA: hypothetical protein VGF75_08315 [Candidatus Saccharimonadales bacterium]|jgi:hypothetical protein